MRNKELENLGESKEVFHFKPEASEKLQVFKNENAVINGALYTLTYFVNSKIRRITNIKVAIKPNGDTLTYVWYEQEPKRDLIEESGFSEEAKRVLRRKR